MRNLIRLGVNIDHVATLRNARGGIHPCPVKAALLAMEAGADGITAHLREDRRHIRDADMERLKAEVKLPLNFEMAATEEMQKIALRINPNAVCLVPEKRTEVTTEGGLDVAAQVARLKEYIKPFKAAGIRVSLFVDPDEKQLEASAKAGGDIVELHTGKYCEHLLKNELLVLQQSARQALQLGLECHAGHGISFDTVNPIAAIPEIVELNIGHFLIGEAVFMGLKEAVQQMKKLMREARI
jgi:pyridoxine 5-phosphate synthase